MCARSLISYDFFPGSYFWSKDAFAFATDRFIPAGRHLETVALWLRWRRAGCSGGLVGPGGRDRGPGRAGRSRGHGRASRAFDPCWAEEGGRWPACGAAACQVTGVQWGARWAVGPDRGPPVAPVDNCRAPVVGPGAVLLYGCCSPAGPAFGEHLPCGPYGGAERLSHAVSGSHLVTLVGVWGAAGGQSGANRLPGFPVTAATSALRPEVGWSQYGLVGCGASGAGPLEAVGPGGLVVGPAG
ncbi:hypothetical protein NDU88_006320 [Pleurodeles waltl]|uniref:Uncharacterized protein n=1 Tax=Pleurodeles waltl TaxID=8319 RepID=A0AAV7TY28_PLEWA|nr:hypothetical protein NDU88_006320 [Pleurodeles waltl]